MSSRVFGVVFVLVSVGMSACGSAPGARSSDAGLVEGGRLVASADSRILSILHAGTLREIEAGRLAQQRSRDGQVRQYGGQVLQDHAHYEQRVMRTARQSGVALMGPEATRRLLGNQRAARTGVAADPITELRSANSAEFDRLFVERRLEAHRELIRQVTSAQNAVGDVRVRDLLRETLPTLRDHERMAVALLKR